MVSIGTSYSRPTGSMATVSVPKIEIETASASLSLNALSSAVAAPAGDVVVSKTGESTFRPFGACSRAMSAPLRWLPPSTDMKPVTGTTIGR